MFIITLALIFELNERSVLYHLSNATVNYLDIKLALKALYDPPKIKITVKLTSLFFFVIISWRVKLYFLLK